MILLTVKGDDLPLTKGAARAPGRRG
jgi:hypothetical protein